MTKDKKAAYQRKMLHRRENARRRREAKRRKREGNAEYIVTMSTEVYGPRGDPLVVTTHYKFNSFKAARNGVRTVVLNNLKQEIRKLHGGIMGRLFIPKLVHYDIRRVAPE